MASPPPLSYDQTYHIYNRGNNREDIFLEERNYRHFLTLYARYIQPVAEPYTYCLLRNHFHVLARIKTVEEQRAYAETPRVSPAFTPKRPSQEFGNLFNPHAKAFNRAYGRTGSLFQNPFGRVMVTSDAHCQGLIAYIHQNPQKHGLVDDFYDWRYSSYRAILSDKVSQIRRLDILSWFDGRASLEAAHVALVDESVIEPLITDDRV